MKFRISLSNFPLHLLKFWLGYAQLFPDSPLHYFTNGIIKTWLLFPSGSSQKTDGTLNGFRWKEVNEGTASRGMGRSEEKNRKWGGHSGSSYWTDVLSISESAVTKGESLQPEPTRRASWQNAATTQIWAGEGVERGQGIWTSDLLVSPFGQTQWEARKQGALGKRFGKVTLSSSTDKAGKWIWRGKWQMTSTAQFMSW